MVIEGKNLFDIFSSHQRKRNTIGETYLLVGVFLKQLERFVFFSFGWP